MTSGNPNKKRSTPDFFRRVFGIAILLTGAVGGLVVMSIWLYDVWTGNVDFTWHKFARITFISFFLAVVGYFILKLSPEEDQF
jgi:hypothetical protein